MRSPAMQLLAVVCAAILFTTVFYKQSIGLNLLLFEVVIISLLAFFKRLHFNRIGVLTLAGTLITAVMVVVHNSVLSIMVNFLAIILLTGTLLLPKTASLPYSFAMSVVHGFKSQFQFFNLIGQLGNANAPVGFVIKWLRIIVLPLAVVFVFAAIYSAANPVFEGLLDGITERLDAWMAFILDRIQISIIFLFIFGMLVCDFLLLKTTEPHIEKAAQNASDELVRKRQALSSKTLDLGLKTEFRSGLILLTALNALLLLVNYIDVYWVWFNFEWTGDYLKQFVHEGTYLLIISIIISIAISMYLFRANQNFHGRNKWLKRLTVVWLIQNMLLALSVGIRNYHYIQHYALAHKRIGVMFFLLATVIGLVLVIIKVRNRKTFHYVLRTNAISVFSILVVMTLVNWDVVIAKYNFKHADRSFVHFDFMIILSNSALPYIDKDHDTLHQIELGNQRFPSEVDYMGIQRYATLLESRKDHFKNDFEERHWLSWNLAYQRSYDKLSE